jgi:hypothetical protein
MATPGEQVDIWRPGEGGRGDPRGGAAGRPVNVTINWTGKVVGPDGLRALFDEMNDMFADGYRLKLNGA